MRLQGGRSGSVLLYVLITSLVVGVIAAYLMRMFLNRYSAVNRQAASTAGRLSNESALAILISNPLTPCVPTAGCQCNIGPCNAAPVGSANCELKCPNPNPTNSNSADPWVYIKINSAGNATVRTTP